MKVVTAAQGMTFRDRQDHFIPPYLLKGESPVFPFKTDEAHFHLPIQHSLHDPRRIADAKDRLYFRVFFNESPQLPRQDIFAGDVASSDQEFSPDPAVKVVESGKGLSLQAQQRLCPLQENLAQGCRRYPSPHPPSNFFPPLFLPLPHA